MSLATDQSNQNRAIQAITRAVEMAETGSSSIEVVAITEADLTEVSAQDLRRLLDRMIVAKHADEGLDALLTAGVLDRLMPEVQAMVGFGDGEWRHKDVWKHTKQVVTQAVPRLNVRWAALFHDIGKVRTRSFGDNGEVHFFGHEVVGARMFDKLEKRQRLFSAEETLRESIRFLVLNHLRAGQYDKHWTDSAVRRFHKEIGCHLNDLLCLSRADITTKRPLKKKQGISKINQLATRIEELAAADAWVPPLPKGVGNELMTRLGLPPSRLLGDIKRALEAACEAGEIPPHQESAFYVTFVEEHRERFGLK